MWFIPALIGGAIRLAGNLVGRAQRAEAARRAIEVGHRNLLEGQNTAAMNANQLAQDNAYVFALSGVSSDFGTPAMVEKMTHNSKAASINRMGRDFEEWSANVRTADRGDAISTIFNVAGDTFSMLSQLYYDNERVLANAGGGGVPNTKNLVEHVLYDKTLYRTGGLK